MFWPWTGEEEYRVRAKRERRPNEAIQRMNSSLHIAAALAVAVAAAHSCLGERYILVPLFQREDLPRLFGETDFTRRTLRFAWHLTSVAWVGFAGVLVQLSSSTAGAGRPQARLIADTFAVSGIVALVGSRGRHLSWLVFLAIAGLVWFGS